MIVRADAVPGAPRQGTHVVDASAGCIPNRGSPRNSPGGRRGPRGVGRAGEPGPPGQSSFGRRPQPDRSTPRESRSVDRPALPPRSPKNASDAWVTSLGIHTCARFCHPAPRHRRGRDGILVEPGAAVLFRSGAPQTLIDAAARDFPGRVETIHGWVDCSSFIKLLHGTLPRRVLDVHVPFTRVSNLIIQDDDVDTGEPGCDCPERTPVRTKKKGTPRVGLDYQNHTGHRGGECHVETCCSGCWIRPSPSPAVGEHDSCDASTMTVQAKSSVRRQIPLLPSLEGSSDGEACGSRCPTCGVRRSSHRMNPDSCDRRHRPVAASETFSLGQSHTLRLLVCIACARSTERASLRNDTLLFGCWAGRMTCQVLASTGYHITLSIFVVAPWMSTIGLTQPRRRDGCGARFWIHLPTSNPVPGILFFCPCQVRAMFCAHSKPGLGLGSGWTFSGGLDIDSLVRCCWYCGGRPRDVAVPRLGISDPCRKTAEEERGSPKSGFPLGVPV